MQLSGDELEASMKAYLNMGVSESNPIEVQQHEIIGTNAHYYIMSKLPRFGSICMWAITDTTETTNNQTINTYVALFNEANDNNDNTAIANFAVSNVAVAG